MIAFFYEVIEMKIKDAQNEFLRYTEEYRSLGTSCRLKIYHTFRVMKLCETIAKSLNLKKKDIEIAKLCGLLHDIGRFEQWRNYSSFDDSSTVDHANLGVEVLEKDDYWMKYFTDESIKETVFNSIRYHNKYCVPSDLSERDQMFCNIVRDADKIDILYLYTRKEIHVDTENQAFSPKVYQSLMKENQINREDKRNKADWLAISLGFLFGINYDESLRILKKNDYYNKEIDIYQEETSNLELKEQLENFRQKVKVYRKG